MSSEQMRGDIDALADRVPHISENAVGSRTLYLVAAVTAHALNLLNEVDRLREAARVTIAGEHTSVVIRERLRAALGEGTATDG